MGIRNVLPREGTPSFVILITPHGDSEPVHMSWEPDVEPAHNPSWGFGTCSN